MSNKKTGVTWGGDAVSSEDEDVDLPWEQGRQIGVKGAGEGLAAGFLLRLVRLGFLVEFLTFFCVDCVISVVQVVIFWESLWKLPLQVQKAKMSELSLMTVVDSF